MSPSQHAGVGTQVDVIARSLKARPVVADHGSAATYLTHGGRTELLLTLKPWESTQNVHHARGVLDDRCAGANCLRSASCQAQL